MADEIKATPRNRLLGLLADGIQGVNDFASKPFGYPNPPANAILGLLGVPQVAQTLDRLSYGEPLTTGAGMTTRPRAEAIDAAMAAIPVARGANSLAMTAGRAGERLAERVVPQVMERGGLLANVLDGLAHGTKSQAINLPNGGLSSNRTTRLISSQRYLDEDRVAQKMANNDFTVHVSPTFNAGGETLQTIEDGHHAMEAARRAGVKPNFIVQSARENDRIGLLNQGKIDDFLEASYIDSPWYYIHNGKEIW